ncbi:MAG: right-handed parallel beta-helix repeat-containing protein [Candidatus Thermoplasmatota archaeon]|nr:right-handed parallel beta-helix repeat-containing protein [Candidatus Thermoplasmatota archaeon]
MEKGRIATIAVFLLLAVPGFVLYDQGPVEANDSFLPMWGAVTYVNDTILYVQENIIVGEGETLIIGNTTVIFNCSCDGEYGFTVEPHGTLRIEKGALLTLNRTGAFSNNHGYNYFINSMGTMSIVDSNISYAGWGDGNNSGVLASRWTTSSNSTFYSCYNGIYVEEGTIGKFVDCDFMDIPGHGILLSENCEFTVDLTRCSFRNIGGWAIKDLENQRYSSPSIICRENTFEKCNGGVDIYHADDSIFEWCLFTNVSLHALYLRPYVISAASYGVMRINRNRFINCSDAIYVRYMMTSEFRENEIVDCPGIGLDYGGMFWVTENNQITGNVFINCSLAINGSSTESDDLLDNSFENCDTGVVLKNMGSMLLHNNTFLNTSSTGIYLHSTCGSNTLYENLFINNSVHAMDGGSQYWYKDQRGNYWSDLVGFFDNNGDGIYDKPYWIDGDSVDQYPLSGLPGQRINQPINMGPLEDRSVFVGEWVNLTFEAHDPDGDEPFFEVRTDPRTDFYLDPATGRFEYPAVPEDVGFIDVEVNVTDNNGSMDAGQFRIVVTFRNLPPVVEPIPTFSIYPGETRRHQLNFSDPNGDEVSVRVESTETPFSLGIDRYFILSFMPYLGQEGDYRAVLNFSDNNGTFTLVGIRIVVLHVNKAPEIMPISDMEAEPGQEFTYQVVVIEDDPDILIFSLNYSGMGDASIDQTGWIRITPDDVDIGIQTVTVEVDDNNGSVVSETFSLSVYIKNHAPVVPDNMVIRVEAGDLMTVLFDVHDPDDEKVFVLPDEDMPEWVKVNEDDLSMHLAPTMDDMGSHDFTIRFMDDEYLGVNMEVLLKVEGTMFPEWHHPPSYILYEREILLLDMGFGYDKNGTPWYRVNGLNDFLSLEGSKLCVSPVDGDSAEYHLDISYGVVNGTSAGPEEMLLIVDRNLSTFWFEVHLEPDREVYEKGESAAASCVFGGYDGGIEVHWVWESGDLVFERCSGGYSLVYLNMSGEWFLYLLMDGEEQPLYSKSFMVSGEKKEENAFPWFRMIMIIVALLIVSLILLSITKRVIKKVRSDLEESMRPANDDDLLPEGYKSAPRLTYHNEEQFVESSDNDYTAVDESAPHDALDGRGEESP